MYYKFKEIFLRIVAGLLKGRKLKTAKGLRIRPTADKIKEALFNILGDRVFNSNFLDLFAGTGNVGIEAFSRGAQKVTFIDNNLASIRLIEENINLCNLADKSRIIKSDYFKAIKKLSKQNEKFDIIFADPPYNTALAKNCLQYLEEIDIGISNCLIIVEHYHKKKLLSEVGKFRLIKQRNFGETILSFYQ